MKRSDIAMIILIASVGMMIAYFVGTNIPLLRVPENGVKVQVIDRIDESITDPSPKVFNENAINPTVEVIVVGSDGAQ